LQIVLEEQEFAILVECLDKSSAAYGTETSVEKSELMNDNPNDFKTEIKANTLNVLKYFKSQTCRIGLDCKTTPAGIQR